MVRERSLVQKRTGKRSVSVPVEQGSGDIYRLAGLRPRRGDEVRGMMGKWSGGRMQ